MLRGLLSSNIFIVVQYTVQGAQVESAQLQLWPKLAQNITNPPEPINSQMTCRMSQKSSPMSCPQLAFSPPYYPMERRYNQFMLRVKLTLSVFIQCHSKACLQSLQHKTSHIPSRFTSQQAVHSLDFMEEIIRSYPGFPQPSENSRPRLAPHLFGSCSGDLFCRK